MQNCHKQPDRQCMRNSTVREAGGSLSEDRTIDADRRGRRCLAAAKTSKRVPSQDVNDVLGRALAAINSKRALVTWLLSPQRDRARAEPRTVLARRSLTDLRALAGGYHVSGLATAIKALRCDREDTEVRLRVPHTPATAPLTCGSPTTAPSSAARPTGPGSPV